MMQLILDFVGFISIFAVTMGVTVLIWDIRDFIRSRR